MNGGDFSRGEADYRASGRYDGKIWHLGTKQGNIFKEL